MTASEAVAYLAERGYPCGVGTVRALARSGRLSCFRPGLTRKGPMAFTPEKLDAFLRQEETGVVAAKPAKPREPRVPRFAPVRDTTKIDWQEKINGLLGKS